MMRRDDVLRRCNCLGPAVSHRIAAKNKGQSMQHGGLLHRCKYLGPTVSHCIVPKIKGKGMQRAPPSTLQVPGPHCLPPNCCQDNYTKIYKSVHEYISKITFIAQS